MSSRSTVMDVQLCVFDCTPVDDAPVTVEPILERVEQTVLPDATYAVWRCFDDRYFYTGTVGYGRTLTDRRPTDIAVPIGIDPNPTLPAPIAPQNTSKVEYLKPPTDDPATVKRWNAIFVAGARKESNPRAAIRWLEGYYDFYWQKHLLFSAKVAAGGSPGLITCWTNLAAHYLGICQQTQQKIDAAKAAINLL